MLRGVVRSGVRHCRPVEFRRAQFRLVLRRTSAVFAGAKPPIGCHAACGNNRPRQARMLRNDRKIMIQGEKHA
jgi:hypothetical protein